WSRSPDSGGFAGCAPKSPMLRNTRRWGRTGPRAHLREAESSRIPRFDAHFRRLLRLWALAQDETLVSGVAGRYASALFSLAQGDRQTDAVAQSLSELDALIAGSPDLARLVRSPVFSANDQLNALDAILARAGIGGIAANFVRLVTVKRRVFAIRDMIAAYRKLYDASRGVTRAEVTSAIAVSDANLAALKDQLKAASGGREVDLDVKVDPSIIGGLIVKLGSRMVDGSLKT